MIFSKKFDVFKKMDFILNGWIGLNIFKKILMDP